MRTIAVIAAIAAAQASFLESLALTPHSPIKIHLESYQFPLFLIIATPFFDTSLGLTAELPGGFCSPCVQCFGNTYKNRWIVDSDSISLPFATCAVLDVLHGATFLMYKEFGPNCSVTLICLDGSE